MVKALLKSVITSCLALVSLAISLTGIINGSWKIEIVIGLTAFGALLVLVSIVLDIRAYRAVSTRFDISGDDGDKKVVQYMEKLLQYPGKVAVVTRDMSWVSPKVNGILLERARNASLTIIMQKETENSKEWAAKGADVHYYEGRLPLPLESRFTLIGYGTSGAELAIGHRANGEHVITRFSKSSDPALSLAKDMVTLLTQAADEQKLASTTKAAG